MGIIQVYNSLTGYIFVERLKVMNILTYKVKISVEGR